MTKSDDTQTLNREDFIVLPVQIRERLLETVKKRLPTKSFGYLLAKADPKVIDDFIVFDANMRNDISWRAKFESYGQYFVEHEDAGFVSTPEESWRLQKHIRNIGMSEVGLFHSHLRHPANFSQIDYDLHTEQHDGLCHMIVSVRNPDLPQLRVFSVSKAAVSELRVLPSLRPEAHFTDWTYAPRRGHLSINQIKDLLKTDSRGRPVCFDSSAILSAIETLLRDGHADLIERLLIKGFLAGSRDRYEEYMAPWMRCLNGGRFEMGTTSSSRRHFVGESPVHTVELSPFKISSVLVTNELYRMFDPRRNSVSIDELKKPAVNLTWYDATLFALWVGCRLPTEAEWEYACGARSAGEWACDNELLLSNFAWYSENTGGTLRDVGTRAANTFGLFDLHGNVWEWCQDSYDQEYYSKSPITNPIKIGQLTDDKVCRGGSSNALAEMCRTRFRLHEPAHFFAADLGVRLAFSSQSDYQTEWGKWSNTGE